MDIGKTNAKLCVVDTLSGELISTESTRTETLDQSPYRQIDTAKLWQWYQDKITALCKTTQISHIAVTAHGATAALINDDGLVLPVMDYEFTGTDDLAEQYNELCDPFTHTYSPQLPMGLNLGRQLFWQRHNCPEQFNSATSLLPYAQYWSWLLTGIAASEVSTIGSHTDLWNPLAKNWSDFARREGFANLFPDLKKAGDILGPPSDALISATGIDADCKVLVGVHDSNASLIPWMKSRKTPFTVMSTGTWVIIFSLGAPLAGLRAERDSTANVNIHGDAIACSRFMGGREFGAIAGDKPQTATLADLLRIIDEDIIALPSFTETGGPYPAHCGKILASRDLCKAERYALACIYCALISDESLNLCASAGDIIVEGAFAKNRLLLQCLAVYRRDQTVYASSDSTGTTMGTAMLVTNTIVTPPLLMADRSDPQTIAKLLAYRKRWHRLVKQSRPAVAAIA